VIGTECQSTVSPLALNETTFPKVLTVIDSSVGSSSSIFAVHALSSKSTIFLSGQDIGSYLRHFETGEIKVHEVDFQALKTEIASSTGPASKPAHKEKEDAKIEGAVQIAIGVKKEVDFASWYTNVSTDNSNERDLTRSTGAAQGRYARLLQR
jgi:prolyl-tRNA synthetase